MVWRRAVATPAALIATVATPALLIATLALVLAAPTAAGAEEREKAKPETKRVQAVGEWAFKRLNQAHEALAQSKHGDALAHLDELKGSSRLNEHEQALMWQTYGYVYASMEKYKQATEAFEKCLAAGGLPETAQRDTQYNLGQLYVMLERFDDAVRVLGEWMGGAENPSAEAHYVYAIALYQKGDKRLALEHGELAVQKASKPQESWLQLVLSLYIDKQDHAKAIGVSEALVAYFPKKAYWMQLSAAYSQVDDYKRALAALALANTQGMLTEDRELTHLAQLYLYNEVPYEAGRLLDEGLTAGKIAGTDQNWRLLSEAWVNARERAKAEKPLAQAASRSSDGELYVRLAQIQFEREAWGAVRESLRHALQKGKLADPGGAQLLLGIASVKDEKWDQARTAFAAAAQYEKNRRSAEQWLIEIETELAGSGAAAPAAEGSKNASGPPLPEPAAAAAPPEPRGGA
jgi:tetratricopeptide (TPR) repeat protein